MTHRPLRVAVVGAGPAGFYTAEHLLTDDVSVEVDLYDRLPTPQGLVRSGVAPDHPKLKSVTRVFERTAARPGFRFFGNVEIGRTVTVADLTAWYDATVYTLGASTHRGFGVPGEARHGSLSATEFVGWYNAHPDHRDLDVDLRGRRALVVGNGNVALDVARILIRDPAELARTDIADHALSALRASAVREVVVLGRRGPAHVSFSARELREFGSFEGVRVTVEGADLPNRCEGAAGKSLAVLRDLVDRRVEEPARRLVFRFLGSPVEIVGDDHVEGVRIVRNRLTTGPAGGSAVEPTTKSDVLAVALVIRAIGYRGEPVPGLPFDETRGVIPTTGGRIGPGLYAAGWIKRGATGLIGANRSCAAETAEALLQDARHGHLPTAGTLPPETVSARVSERVRDFVTYQGWQAIDARERRLGEPRHRPRVKFTRVAEMLEIAHEPVD